VSVPLPRLLESARHAPTLRDAVAAVALRPVDLLLAGPRGQVGSALRRLLAREAAGIAARTGIALRLRAAFDRRGLAHDAEGLDPFLPDDRLAPRHPRDWPERIEHAVESGTPTVLVDCTASEELADEYPTLLSAGIGVAGANKRAGAGPLARWQRLQALSSRGGAPWRYETTVGAALPVLSTLRALRLRGERILGIEGVLSGSLSYVLARLHEGASFSAAVAEARAKGYTEPDPREDLAARDLARKIVILAREAGAPVEADAVAVEPLVDPQRWLPDAPDGATDFRWRVRADDAEARGRRLVAVASWDEQGARVAVRDVPQDSPLARVRAGENLLRIRTEFHDALPLLIGGPGAGPEVTAAGVLGDILSASRALLARRGGP
jgi:aspartokinase/homoserine dehydrogenase 1